LKKEEESNNNNNNNYNNGKCDELLNEFSEKIKEFPKEDYRKAREYCLNCLESFPEKIHWKIISELAERAKKSR